MNEINLTINTYSDSKVRTSSWPIWKEEPERVAVNFKGKEYVIVLDDNPYFEVWSTNEEGELNEHLETLKTETKLFTDSELREFDSIMEEAEKIKNESN